MEYLGAWGALIHEKILSRKSRVRLPLKHVEPFALENAVWKFERIILY